MKVFIFLEVSDSLSAFVSIKKGSYTRKFLQLKIKGKSIFFIFYHSDVIGFCDYFSTNQSVINGIHVQSNFVDPILISCIGSCITNKNNLDYLIILVSQQVSAQIITGCWLVWSHLTLLHAVFYCLQILLGILTP